MTAGSDERPMVEFDKVSMRFGLQAILRDISFQLPRGKTLAIIGESGCGKTVTLKLIVGLLRPTSGRVVFDGKVLTELGERELARERLRIGFLFQGSALFDSLSVYDNIAFGMRANRVAEKEIIERVRRHVEEVGLPANVEKKMPAELSGGMRKRVGLARALALDPELMLYDEPTTGLDPVMSDVINELIIRSRMRSPMTCVVVTHDMNTVRRVADRVVMLYPLARLGSNDPQVIFDGTPNDLGRSPDPRVRAFVEGNASERLRAQGDEVRPPEPGAADLEAARDLSLFRTRPDGTHGPG
jgi:phospholipid/cholesterol/gamma-HCH transport system ATP-binding protein